ncbi:ATP synthase subunit delta [Clostridia bacterium]|nr:ATP synthase subunit delta [Clostridia bacterium]
MSLLETSYAEALLSEAGSADAESVGDELIAFLREFQSDAQIALFFKNPVVSSDTKKKVIGEALSETAHKAVKNFLFLLVDNKRINLLSAIIDSYLKLLPKNSNKKLIKIYSAASLDAQSIEAIAEKYRGETAIADIETEVMVDKTLIGGVCVQIGDKRYDGTIKTKLKHLSEQLTQVNC